MFIVAHPDDETGAAGILLQRVEDAMVVFCTDGAPTDPWFWDRFGTREAYAAMRRREALDALSVVDVKNVSFLTGSNPMEFRDQLLHRSLPSAIELLLKLVRWYSPDALVTTAYEGGHPDHDSCSFISSVVGSESGVPVWEVPLYHRTEKGDLRCQSFADANGSETAIVPNTYELQRKREMLTRYRSQPDLEMFAASPVEYIRRQKLYDYALPPATTINYEVWGWKVYASELCKSFTDAELRMRTKEKSISLRALGTQATANAQ